MSVQHETIRNDDASSNPDNSKKRKKLNVYCSWLFLMLTCCNFAHVRWHIPRRQHRLQPAIFPRIIINRLPLPFLFRSPSTIPAAHRTLKSTNKQGDEHDRLRILYIITSVHEKDTGKRETVKNYDRFGKTMVPLIKESLLSLSQQFDVDVYLIAHYNVTESQHAALRAALPERVGLQVWNDASPLGYSLEHSTQLIQDIVRALSRQHRYVIKDKWMHYHAFVNFEDDMLIKAEHVQQFIDTTQLLYTLRRTALDKFEDMPASAREMLQRYHGPMTQLQLERMIPGFIRVEVNLGKGPDGKLRNHCGQERNRFPNIPQDYEWNASLRTASIDPVPCCHLLLNETLNELRPYARPAATDLYYWETGIEALGVRQLPNGDWYVLQVGNRDEFYTDPRFPIGDYWSGRDGYFMVEPPGGGFAGDKRPDRTKGRYANNQGGWMATRRQIIDWHRKWCRGGGFLPPYDPPGYPWDGLDLRSVEYWSGGLQISGPLGCNLQRIVTMDPTKFGRHLLYHTSNNKQRSINVGHRYSGLSIQEFWAQLNTVRKNAERAMSKEEEKKKKQ